MNFSQHLFRSLLCLLILVCTHEMTAQSSSFEEGKYSVGGGIGMEYGLLGITGKYFPFSNLGITATIGGPLAYCNVGLEANIPFVIKDRLVPYITIRYGTNSRVHLYSRPDPLLEPMAIEKRSYNGLAYCAGFKYKFNQDFKQYLTFSINYVARSSSPNEFIEQYNLANGTNFESNYNDFIRPSIGYVFYFK